MARLVADYAFDRPSLTALKAAGVEGVARYLAPMPNGKVLNTNPSTEQFDGAEMAELAQLSMSLVVVWETTATRTQGGWSAGVTDAQRANDMADQLGIPTDRPVYYAVDFDGRYPGAIKSYFDGARSVGRRAVGIYASYSVCEAALADGIPFAWQTVAWSNGQLLESAHLYQRNFHSVNVPGGWDENVVLQEDWGQWVPGTTTHIPAPTPATIPQEDTMAVRYALPNGQVFVTDGLARRYVGSPLKNDVLNDIGCKLVSINSDHVQAFHDSLRDLDALDSSYSHQAQDIAATVVASLPAGPAVDADALAAKIAAAISIHIDAPAIAASVSKVLGTKLSS